MKTIGVLAVQGAYQKHADSIVKVGCKVKYVKTASDLDQCDRLILPGGESTTIINLLNKHKLFIPLKEFAQYKPILGTCAGLILMAEKQDDFDTLNILSVTVKRNSYGRQLDSFSTNINCSFKATKSNLPVFFIRAPEIISINSNKVQVISTYRGSPILVQQGRHLGMTFHPELTNNTKVLEYFLSL